MQHKTKESTWLGRSLTNYVAMHPKAKGAKTLTEARKLAFGSKNKKYEAFRKRSGV